MASVLLWLSLSAKLRSDGHNKYIAIRIFVFNSKILSCSKGDTWLYFQGYLQPDMLYNTFEVHFNCLWNKWIFSTIPSDVKNIELYKRGICSIKKLGSARKAIKLSFACCRCWVRTVCLTDVSSTTQALQARFRELQEELMCKVCRNEQSVMVFIPCGHLCCCQPCSAFVNECPLCGAKMVRMVRSYTSWNLWSALSGKQGICWYVTVYGRAVYFAFRFKLKRQSTSIEQILFW